MLGALVGRTSDFIGRLVPWREKISYGGEERSRRKITQTQQVLVLLAATILYLNGLPGDFAYDDSRAIQSNEDVLPSTPWYRAFQNDFWGTPIGSSNSHGSYRPITVLTFRLNVLLHGLSPLGFHVLNLGLHLLVTLLYMKFLYYVLEHRRITLISTLLFASHPIHVESVTSIVGRADLAAALFYLVSLLSYARFVRSGSDRSDATTSSIQLYASLLSAALSMLSKEHGITCLAICGVYHLFVVHRFFPFLLRNYQLLLREPHYVALRKGLLHLTATAIALLLARFLLMSSAPTFAPADNPASNSSSVIIRFLTFLYLPAFNFWLLLHPRWLSFDWSMDSIPLISSPFDSRNLLTILFYISLFILLLKIFRYYFVQFSSSNAVLEIDSRCSRCESQNPLAIKQHFSFDDNNNSSSAINYMDRTAFPFDSNNNDESAPNQNVSHYATPNATQFCKKVAPIAKPAVRIALSRTDCLLFSLALTIIPFLPASNLFFYVGFVVAERILYIPSLGYCLFVAVCIESTIKLAQKSSFLKSVIYASLCFLLVAFSLRTVLRNVDWLNEENLYRSGIAINPPKSYGNLANILNLKGRSSEAEWAYRKALQYRPNMADVHYNLGLLLQEQKRYEEALDSYYKAISYRPRLAIAHLNLAIVLVQLGRKDQAKKVYRHCAEIDARGLKDVKLHESTKISALYNLGRLYADEEKYEQALQIFQEAVVKMPPYYAAQWSLFNVIGEMHAKLGQNNEAEAWFRKSLSLKRNHIPVHLTYAKLLGRLNRTKEADELYRKALRISPNESSIYHHYGQFVSNSGNLEYALQVYRKGLEVAPANFDLVIGIANTLRELRKNEEAEKYYKTAQELRPKDVISYSNLGAIYHLNGKYQLAMENYMQALKIKPDDSITQTNLAKLKQAMGARSS